MFFGITIATIAILDALALGGIAVMMLVEAVGIGIAAAVIAGFALLAILAIFVTGPAPIAVGIGGIIILLLLALAISMMIGAIIGKRSTITSWPIQQEQSFASFDRRVGSSHAMGMLFAIVGGALVFFIAVGIYAFVPPEERDYGKSMNMSNLTKKAKTPAPAPTPTPAPAEAPKTDTPKTDTPAPDKK
jgi:hypothetical protein